MIDLYGVLQEQETVNGELGLGVDYYKGETGAQGIPGKDGKDGKTPIKGVDYYTDEEIASIKDEIAQKVQVGAKGEDGKSAYQIALDEGFEGSETDWLASLKGADGRNGIDGINGTNGKDGINGKDGKTPVKGVDYFTQAEIQQIENNVAAKVDLSDYAKSADLSTVATSGSYNDLKDKPTIPAAYELPTASATTLGGVKVDGNTITIADGVISSVGGSGGSEPEKYIKDASVNGNTLTLTKKDDTPIKFTPSMNKQSFHYQTKVVLTDEQKTQIQKIKENINDYDMFINDVKIIRITKVGTPVYYFGFSDSPEDMRVDKFMINLDGMFEYRGSSDIITGDNWMSYITVSSNDWQYTQDQYDSNLYNAKELVVYVENISGNKQMGYFNFGANGSNLGSNTGNNFYFGYDTSSPYISYDGSNLTYGNANNIQWIYYKS